MNSEDRSEFDTFFTNLKSEVNKDIQLAIAKLQILIMGVLLSNIMFIGFPALYVFFNTTNTAERAMDQSIDNTKRLNAHANYINSHTVRINGVESFLSENGYEPPKELVTSAN